MISSFFGAIVGVIITFLISAPLYPDPPIEVIFGIISGGAFIGAALGRMAWGGWGE